MVLVGNLWYFFGRHVYAGQFQNAADVYADGENPAQYDN